MHYACRQFPWLITCSVTDPSKRLCGRDYYLPQHRFLAEDESFAVAARFRRDHPWRLGLFSVMLGWGNLRNDETAREFVLIHPFVGLRPLRLSNGGAEQMPDAVRQRQSGGAADDHPRDGQTNIATADPRAHGAGDAECDWHRDKCHRDSPGRWRDHDRNHRKPSAEQE